MRKFNVTVIQTVEVQLDETAFTPEFFEQYRSVIDDKDTVEEHAEYLAWAQASGLYDMEGEYANPFAEGYGPVKDMGISARVVSLETEIEP